MMTYVFHPQGTSLMPSTRVLSLACLLPLLLIACTSQTSVEKHARHIAYQIAQAHFDPNTKPLTADNARELEPFLRQFYTLGKKDRAAGLSTSQAQQRVNTFSNDDGPFAPGAQKTIFINRHYDADQPGKRSDILKQGAIATYWDGYNGRP